MEIHEKARLPPAKPQVRQELRFVNGDEPLDRFQFDYQSTIHDEIDSVPTIQPNGFVDDRQRPMPVECQSAYAQFIGEALFIGGFEQPRTKMAMDLDSRSDNLLSQAVAFVCTHLPSPFFRRLCVSVPRWLTLL